jgi:hypothetical protein
MLIRILSCPFFFLDSSVSCSSHLLRLPILSSLFLHVLIWCLVVLCFLYLLPLCLGLVFLVVVVHSVLRFGSLPPRSRPHLPLGCLPGSFVPLCHVLVLHCLVLVGPPRLHSEGFSFCMLTVLTFLFPTSLLILYVAVLRIPTMIAFSHDGPNFQFVSLFASM